eukprot:gene10557-22020_t
MDDVDFVAVGQALLHGDASPPTPDPVVPSFNSAKVRQAAPIGYCFAAPGKTSQFCFAIRRMRTPGEHCFDNRHFRAFQDPKAQVLERPSSGSGGHLIVKLIENCGEGVDDGIFELSTCLFMSPAPGLCFVPLFDVDPTPSSTTVEDDSLNPKRPRLSGEGVAPI